MISPANRVLDAVLHVQPVAAQPIATADTISQARQRAVTRSGDLNGSVSGSVTAISVGVGHLTAEVLAVGAT